MRKKIIKVILLLIIFGIAISGLFAVNAKTYPFYTKATNKSTNKQALTNWSGVSKVYVDQRGTTKDKYNLTLNQYNVFCVQHGTKVKNDYYKVSKEYTVSDDTLAYILYNGTKADKDGGIEGTWANSWQKKLWAYLYDNKASKSEEIETIIGGKSISNCDANYNDAKEYATKIKNFQPSVKLTENGDNINVSVTGLEPNTEFSYVVTRDEKKDTYTKTSDKDGKWSGEIAKNSTKSFTVSISGSIERYKVKYRILSHAQGQRILVVTETDVEDYKITDEEDWTAPNNVSLQKYIVATSADKTTYSNITGRNNKNATSTSNNTISWNKKGSNDSYKSKNPVEIYVGDYVVYRIDVYNNNKSEAKNVVVIDRIMSKYCDIVGIYKGDKTSDIANKNLITKDSYLSRKDYGTEKENYIYYKWNVDKISGNGTASFLVVVQYKNYTTDTINNKASVAKNDSYRYADYDFITMLTDVSLQKYITQVGTNFDYTGGTLTVKENLSNRSLRMATKSSTAKLFVEGHPTASSYYSSNTANNNYKNQDPVKINAGNYVVYRIDVYNNKKNKVSNVKIRDALNKSGKLVGIYKSFDNSNKFSDEVEIHTYSVADNPGYNYCWWYAEIDGNSYTTYWAVVEYENPTQNKVLANWAYINEGQNKSEYCVNDRDYVILTDYAVSLNKYVSKVTDKNGDKSLSYDSRLDTRFNAYAEDTSNKSNYNEYKKNNPVSVELGDIVTYTIQLKNEGSAQITIKEIYDYYDSGALTYNNSITQGTWQSAETATLNGRKDGKDISDMSCAKISFGDGITLDKGATTTVDITFKVEKEKDSVYNIAQVKEIFDGDVAVNDSDGEDNNTDEDWIKFKTYAVSLEKYVYQVDKNNVDSREGKAEYLTYKDGKYVDETTKDTKYTEHNQYKYNKAVETSNGYTVEYRIKVKNDGESSVYISEIKDYLPLGVRYEGIEYGAVAYDGTIDSSKAISLNKLSDTLIEPGKNKDILISVYVTEPNSSINVLKNIAEITEIKNRNGIVVTDTTPNNNKDADYIVLNTGTSSDKVEYNVEKVWDDGDGTGRPSSIKVQLYQNDSKYGAPAEVSDKCDEPWKYTWRDLPKYDSDGKLYIYKAIEEDLSGYTVSYEYGDNLAVITNKKETITKKVEKVWADSEGNILSSVPENTKVKLKLLQNETEYKTIELPYENEWTYTWEGLPKYDNSGKEYIYTIKETEVTINEKDVTTYYKTDISTSGETVIIKNIQIDSETVSKTVTKEWELNGATLPSSVQVQLYRDGKKMEGDKYTVLLNSENNWTYTWNELDKYNSSGNEYIYTVEEVNVPTGFVADYTTVGNETIITNTYEESEQDEEIITVTKVWEDSSGNEITPAEETTIQVQLCRDGTPMDGKIYTVELNSGNNWTYTWDKLDKYDLSNRKEYQYTVTEVEVPTGYTVNYSVNGNEIIVTNKENNTGEKVSKTVKKVWEDTSGNTVTPAEGTTIQVQLNRDGTPMDGEIYTVLLNSENNWTAKWDDLDKYDSSGNEYQYTVTEVNVPEGYTVNYSINGDEIIVTNKENNTGEKVSKTVKKVWLDSSGKAMTPAEGTSIEVQLYQNGTPMSDSYKKTLSSTNNWTDTWSDLDKYDSDGNEYQYTVQEVNVPEGYTAIYKDDGFTIQNKKIEYTNITVKKGWIDEEESHNSITVQLYKDGTLKHTVELDSDNNWTYTWVSLPKTGAYTVTEVNVPEGYTATTMTTESDTDITFIIKNTKTDPDPDPDPDPEDPNNPPSKPDPVIPTDVVISGYVWNDMALNKTSNSYDGIYNADEKPLSGVSVYLYRTDNLNEPITSTRTVLGYYSFGDSSVGDKGIRVFETKAAAEKASENFIKGKRRVFTWIDENGKTWYEISNIWEKYYSYYIVFEYDGITYTSSTYTSFSDKSNLLDSNAKENGEKVLETRENFNNRFSTINNESGISYYTTNEDGYIPQSIHYYNSNMSIQSSTECIEMGGLSAAKEIYLKYINLGLRGRDTFDLELTSDVEKVEVTINDQQGVYNYGNKVTLRRTDFDTRDDMANVDKETSNKYVDDQYQNIRSKDIGDKLTEILVTYKITVQNDSATAGTATKVTNYYDKKYTFKGAYSDSSCSNILSDATVSSGTNYNSVVITTPGTQLNQSDPMEIYVVYSYNLADYKDNLISLENGHGLATYNMAEITEYTTSCGDKQTEFTRGLIDKDSAPGSAATEKVRLTTDTDKVRAITTGSQTTVDYYFKGENLEQLKYEDDTYATPTLYFVKDGNERTITGTVFEDKTTTNSETKIKTGNGKLDDGEVGVYGATVLLLERINGDPFDSSELIKIEGTNYNKYYALKDGENTIWYEYKEIYAISDRDGSFTLSGFLPGEYIIVYHYGDTNKTTLLCQSDDERVNQKSYNGEDFQSANNTGTADSSELNDTEGYWYVYNEANGISTGTDNVDRRLDVSKNVTGFIDEEMKALNNIRVSSESDDVEVTYNNDGTEKSVRLDDIISETRMYANTKSMLFTVEKTELITSETKQKTEFSDYNIANMNFGISAVPVTTVDLQKQISKLTITDSTGSNIIATYDANESSVQKGVTKTDKLLYAQIEDEKLQGARLEIEYTISLNIETEVNFDSKIRHITPTITGLVDFVDNNLSYNEELGNNKDNWEIITYTDIKNTFVNQMYDGITAPEGTVDPNGEKYTTILKAKDSSSEIKNLLDGSSTVTLTLEKVLTAGDSLITEILDDALDTSTYNNIIEIIGFDYHNTSTGVSNESLTFEQGQAGIDTDGDGTKDAYVMRDRIRTNITDEDTGRKIEVVIIPGVQHDTASAETFVITPPTGDMSIAMIYLLVAILSLGILAGGIFGIKKFVIKK